MSETRLGVKIDHDAPIGDTVLTPPTPDRAAVRDALAGALRKVPPFEMLALGGLLFGDRVFSPDMVADALVAAQREQ